MAPVFVVDQNGGGGLFCIADLDDEQIEFLQEQERITLHDLLLDLIEEKRDEIRSRRARALLERIMERLELLHAQERATLRGEGRRGRSRSWIDQLKEEAAADWAREALMASLRGASYAVPPPSDLAVRILDCARPMITEALEAR